MAKGLTDAQLDAMDEMEARQNLYGTAARVLESPDAAPMTDAQMNQRATSDSVMQATPFGQATMPQSAPQPPQADFREPPKPLTDAELNAQEDNLYYDPSYEMPFEEFAPVHARRQQEKNTVGSFVDGAVAAGQGLVSLTAEMGGELRDNFTSNLFRPDRFATQNFVTLKEAGRKAGLEFAKLVDWIGNTARDHATDVRRQEQVRSVIAQKLQAEGKLSGDLRGDIEIINREFAAAKERGETAPTPLEENADVEQAFEDYRRGKNFDREIAGVGNFSIGQTPVTQESSEARATNSFTGEVMEPQRALATGGAMAFAPDNLLPVGAGVMSKVRILRRLSSITGVPLKMTENVANAGANALQRGAMRITDKVQDLTGMNAMQQTAAATALTGGVGYLSTQGQGAPAALGGVATGVLSILPIMKFGGAILRRTGATAGGGYAIVREMGAGGAGAVGAETAQAMASSGVFPQRYARHMRPGGASVDSTMRRVAQDPENPQMLRRLARTANNLGATQAFRLTDDVVSSAAVSGLAAAPFALVAPDAEQGGQIVGGALMLGTLAGTATRTFGRRPAEVDADIARMLVDVTESNGDAASLMSLSHDSLSQLAAMQGVLRNKVKFIPLRGQDYRANADLRAAGGETAAGLYIEKDANGSARIFVNMGHTAPMDGKVSVRPDADKGGNVIDITAADGTVDSTHVPQGIRLLVKTGDAVSANQRLAQDLSPTRIVPHEIGHAILTSDILDGQPRNDLRNLVNQQYATDGVAARGREYATRLVDKDILVGAIEDAPVNLTDAQINDISSGKTTLADVLKGQPVSEQARQRLIDQRVEELSQRSIEKGQDPLDWARDEIIAETFASEAPAIDFRAIRRDALFPRLAESMLSAGGRVLEVMGARLDPGTGKLMDNPSVLFRDNPLFQDRIMQKRVREYVRSYDQYLAGLEEAGAKELRGVELARSSKPEDLARSTHVKLRDEGNGVLENDFMVQRPDGTYTMKAQKTVNLTENARSAQIKTLYDARKFVPVNSQEFGKRKVNGREVVGGPVLPPQFDFFTHFPQHVREFARSMEQSRAEGGSWDIDYNAIGTGASGRYRVTNLGNVRAIQRETVPFGWQVTKANHLLAASLDLNAFRASAMKAINKGDLGLFNNDMRQVEADLKTYLANHRNGMPGEMTIGQQKRDMLNGLIGTGTAVQRTANPLYSDLNPRGSIRTWRVDRLNDAKPTGRTGYFFDYDKINNNRMPSALPQTGMAMPDTPANLSTDQILRELEENQGYLGLSTLGMREGRPVKGGAQQTRELLKRNTALNEELKRRGGPQEESDVERVLRQRGQAMPDAVDPIAAAAVRESDGKIFTGPLHTNAIEKAIAAGYKDGGYPKSDYGFVTKGGQFLSSEDAREYAITQRQVTRQGLDKWEAELGIDGMPGLESGAFALAKSEAKKFQKFDDNFSKAATRGDLAAAEKINDQAAKELGLRSAVHATSAEPFSQFKIHPEGDVQHGFPAIFFSDSDMGYGRHRGAKGQRRVEKFYIRMERPLDLRKHKSNTDHPDYQKAWERYSKVFEKAVEQGRVTQDSIVLGPLLDELPFDSFILHEAKGFSYAVLDPSQIVSAQPILQNADGSPVLPSQRFASALATKNTIARPATGRTRGQAMPDVADAPPFFLKSSQALDAKIQGKAATPNQVKAILTNPQNGIKAEELKWTGVMQEVERLAKENNGKVPKEALLRYLAEDGAVRFEEVKLASIEAVKAADRLWNALTERGIADEAANGISNDLQRSLENPTDVYLRENVHSVIRKNGLDPLDFDDRVQGIPKYGQYQLPGGENYREVVLAMPEPTEARKSWSLELGSNIIGIFKTFEDAQRRQRQQPNSRIVENPVENWKTGQNYTSTHFDTPNYVAHMRLNERVDAKGKQGLFIEELQSDRHQSGRDAGYVGEELPLPQGYRIEKSPIRGFIAYTPDGESLGGRDTTTSAIQSARMHAGLSSGKAQVPDAPFRTSWPLQLFKRALRDAVADGKDWIGWTTGETQAARYDLSKQVDSVNVSRGGGETWEIWADKDGRNAVRKDVSSIAEVAEVIGKELAKKVEDMKPGESARTFSGVDLKVGGEGMKGFYDTMVPKDVAKYVKQWGAQVEKDGIGSERKVLNPSDFIEWHRAQNPNATEAQSRIAWAESTGAQRASAKRWKFKDVPIWRVNITPQMREGIKKAGQALFAGGAAAVVAEDQLEQ